MLSQLNIFIKFTGYFVMCLCLVVICFNKKHLINLFIMLEVLVLSLLIIMFMLNASHVHLIMLLFCVGVCEAGLSLSLLFMMMRTNGKDLVSLLRLF